MSFRIPEQILNASDRNQTFQNLKNWMEESLAQPHPLETQVTSSGCSSIDDLLGGGFLEGCITELVEPQFSHGGNSLIHHAINQARSQQHYLALIDAHHQFDPHSANLQSLECLLWIRCMHSSEAIKAADIILRDGNFPFVMMDCRNTFHHEMKFARTQIWYRLQHICEQSSITFVALTSKSTIPSAQFRLQLTSPVPLDLLDQVNTTPFSHVQAVSLKRRMTFQTSEKRPQFAVG